MTDHERAAMEAAAVAYTFSGRDDEFVYAWEAARAYEPPPVCNAKGPQAFRCSLPDDGHEEHRAGYDSTLNAYIGWPRT